MFAQFWGVAVIIRDLCLQSAVGLFVGWVPKERRRRSNLFFAEPINRVPGNLGEQIGEQWVGNVLRPAPHKSSQAMVLDSSVALRVLIV